MLICRGGNEREYNQAAGAERENYQDCKMMGMMMGGGRGDIWSITYNN